MDDNCFRQAWIEKFGRKAVRENADGLAAIVEDFIRQNLHRAFLRAAEHKRQPMLGHFLPKFPDSIDIDWILRYRRSEINGYGMDFCHIDSLDWLHFLQYKPYSNFLQKLSSLFFCGNGKPVYIMKV